MTDADALAPVGAATHLPADLLPDPALVGPRCLVTGGSGYLGRALVARLLDAGCEVSTLDLTDEGPDSRVRHVTGDLRDYDAIAPAFEGVTTVFHSAALIATVEERFAQPALRRRAYGVNVVGTENVLRAARASGVRALVHISSFNVVMDHAIEGGDESLPYATNAPDLYSRTKIAAERAVLAADGASTALASGAPAADAFLRTVALRPGGIWGPGRGGMMLDAMVAELAKGTFKATIGDGHTPLDNTHVENVVDAAVLAARGLHERPARVGGRAYFITDGERFDAMEWFRPLVEGLGHPFPRLRVPGALMLRVATGLELAHRLGGPVPTITRRSIRNLTEGAHFSIARAGRELGYEPRFHREDLSTLLPELRRYHDQLQREGSAS